MTKFNEYLANSSQDHVQTYSNLSALQLITTMSLLVVTFFIQAMNVFRLAVGNNFVYYYFNEKERNCDSPENEFW